MIIERQSNQIVIRIDSSLIDIKELQRFTDYFRFLESNAKNQGTEKQAAELARDVERTWWSENKHRFLQ